MTEELYPEISRNIVGYHRHIRYERRAGIIPCGHPDCSKTWATAFRPARWIEPSRKSQTEVAFLFASGDIVGIKGRGLLVVSPPYYACGAHRRPGYLDLDRERDHAPICEYCGASSPQWVESATSYSWEATSLPVNPTAWDWLRLTTVEDFGPDPNRPHALCAECAEQYNDWWDEQWREYRSSQL